VAKDVRYIRVALSHFIHSLHSNKIYSEVVQHILLSFISLKSWSWPPIYPLQPIIPPIASSNLHIFYRRVPYKRVSYSVYLIGVYLISAYLISVYLIGVYLITCILWAWTL
jgi:hypothetical protein